MKKIKLSNNTIVNFSGMAMFLIASVILGFLAYESARVSYYPPTDYVLYNWSVPAADSLVKNALYCAIGICALFFLSRLCEKHIKSPGLFEKVAVNSLAAIYVIAGIIYVSNSPYYPSGDQISTTAAAAYALKGNYDMFQSLGYIGIYPFQKGLVLFYEIIFKIFGSFNYTPVKILTVFMNTATMLLGARLVKDLGGGAFSAVIYSAFTTACLPYFYLMPYAYGDLPSIFGTMVLVFYFRRFLTDKKWYHFAAACAGSVFAVMTRGTAWIAVISLIIIAVMVSVDKKKWYPVASMAIIAILSWSSVTAVSIGYEKASGYDRGTGSPFISIIAMGMQETWPGAPGAYNRYQQTVYEQCAGDRNLASVEAKNYIRSRLREFAVNKAMARDFYLRKLRFQWTEPLFETTTHTHSFKEDTVVTGFFDSFYYGKVHDTSFKFMNRYQTFLYLICFLYAIRCIWEIIRKKSCAEIYHWFFFIHMTGGFILTIFWESKARYNIPYFVFLIPVIALFFDKKKKAGI